VITLTYIRFLLNASSIFGQHKIFAIFPAWLQTLVRREICNEYAAQTMLSQSQDFPTEKKPDFVWLFWIFKKSKVREKSQNFKIWLQKSKIRILESRGSTLKRSSGSSCPKAPGELTHLPYM